MPLRLPSLAALRTFEAAARLGSFRAAAEELGVTPTAVSHQIRSLEDTLGIALFLRRTRVVELTPEGRQLAASVGAALAGIGATLEEIAGGAQVVRVATTPAFAALWLAPRLGRFQERHLGLRVEIEADVEPVDLARERRIDLAIRYGGKTGGQECLVFPTERFGAFAAPGYMDRLGERAVLYETVWEGPALAPVRWRDWLGAAGEPGPLAAGEVRAFADEHHVVQCGIAGQGLIIASTLLVGGLVRQGLLVPYRPELTLEGGRYSVLTARRMPASRRVRQFIDWLASEVEAGAG